MLCLRRKCADYPVAGAAAGASARSAARGGRMAQLPVAQQVGGYQMPSIGVIGGLAGVGGAASVAAAKPSTKVSRMTAYCLN